MSIQNLWIFLKWLDLRQISTWISDSFGEAYIRTRLVHELDWDQAMSAFTKQVGKKMLKIGY
jgi:hypothetical protein